MTEQSPAHDDTVGQDEAAVDEYVRIRFGVESVDDRSGLFTGKPSTTPGEPDEDALFEAYMRRYFPGSVGYGY